MQYGCCVRRRCLGAEAYRCAPAYRARPSVCLGLVVFPLWTFWNHVSALWNPFEFAIKESLTPGNQLALAAPTKTKKKKKTKPHLTQNNSFCLRSKQHARAFNLGYVYSYDFLSFLFFFFPPPHQRVIGVLLVASEAAEEAMRAEENTMKCLGKS